MQRAETATLSATAATSHRRRLGASTGRSMRRRIVDRRRGRASDTVYRERRGTAERGSERAMRCRCALETSTGAQIRFRSQDLRGSVSASRRRREITAGNLRAGRWTGCALGPRRARQSHKQRHSLTLTSLSLRPTSSSEPNSNPAMPRTTRGSSSSARSGTRWGM